LSKERIRNFKRRHYAERNFEWKIGKKNNISEIVAGKNGKKKQAYSMKISVRLEVISEFFIPASNHRPRHGEA